MPRTQTKLNVSTHLTDWAYNCQPGDWIYAKDDSNPTDIRLLLVTDLVSVNTQLIGDPSPITGDPIVAWAVDTLRGQVVSLSMDERVHLCKSISISPA